MRRYTTVDGRTSRYDLVAYFLSVAVLLVTIAVIGRLTIGTSGSDALIIFAILAHIVPTGTVAVRRMHDANSSGFELLIGLLPYLGWLVVFWLLFFRPSAPANRFGDIPEDRRSAASHSPLEKAGWLMGRVLKSLQARVTERERQTSLPEPPASLANALGVSIEPSLKPSESNAQRSSRLERLRDAGMLSEAEFIRLSRELV